MAKAKPKPKAKAKPKAAKSTLSSPLLQESQQLANIQKQLNEQAASLTAQYNRVNQAGPFGSTSYSQGPNGQWSQRTDLQPELEHLYGKGMAFNKYRNDMLLSPLLTRSSQLLDKPIYFDNLPEAPDAQKYFGDLGEERKRIEEEIYGKYSRRLDPMFQQDQENFQQQMANQGIPIGTEKYRKLMDEFSQRKTDAYRDAQTQAITGGGQELQLLRGEQQRKFDAAERQRANALQDIMTERRIPLDEMAMILSQQTQYPFPEMGQIPQVAVNPADVMSPYLNLKGLQQQKEIANKQLAAAHAGGGGGGGDPYAMADYKFGQQLALNEQSFQQQQQLASLSESRKPKPSPWGGIAGAAAGGFASALGGSIGRKF